jgi:hypothetical protein
LQNIQSKQAISSIENGTVTTEVSNQMSNVRPEDEREVMHSQYRSKHRRIEGQAARAKVNWVV